MNSQIDSLRQLTLGITLLSSFFIIISILFNRMFFKLAFSKFLKSFILYKKIYIKLFLIFFTLASLLSLAYSSISVADTISNAKAHDYFGEYKYAYLQTSDTSNLDNFLSVQDQSKLNSQIKKGIYYNLSINNEGKYIPNVALLAFNDLNLGKDQFYSKSDEIKSNWININTNSLYKDDNIQNLNGLDNFSGWTIGSNKSPISIFTNITTAKEVSEIENENIIFSKNKLDNSTQTLTKNLSDNDKKTFVNTITEISFDNYKSSFFQNSNPFPILMILLIGFYLVLFYPLYKLLTYFQRCENENIEKILSTGARQGVVTKYLNYYFFIPFILLTIISSITAYFSIILLYNVFNLSYLFSIDYKPLYEINLIDLLFIFTNLFALTFLGFFLIFYLINTQIRRYKKEKISIVRLTLGIASVLFGPIMLFFIKDFPEEIKGLIPFVIICAPIISLLGSIIFLRLINKWRYIALITALVLYILGLSFILIHGDFKTAPSGIFLMGLVGEILLSLILNQFGFKEYPKLIIASITVFLITFGIVVSKSGFTIYNSTNKDFNLTVQTYSANDKRINFESLFPKESVKSKVSTAKAIVVTYNDKNEESATSVMDLVSVNKNALNASNLSNDEKDKFYNSNDLVILPQEYKDSQNIKEGDEIELKEITTGKKNIFKVFKILAENTNQDITNKIIYPNLDNLYNTKRSSLNDIYLLNISDDNKKNDIKNNLSKYNIFDVIDINQKINDSKENSSKIINSLMYLLTFILLIVVLFTKPKDNLKGYLNSIISLLIGTGCGIIYLIGTNTILTLNNDITIFLFSIFIIISLIYGSNIAYRKIKNYR